MFRFQILIHFRNHMLRLLRNEVLSVSGFCTELPSNAHLKIIVNDSLPETALIGRAQGSSKGWVSYREGNNSIYYADGPEIADMILRFHDTGKSTINIYENNSAEPNRIKIISW